MGDNLITTECLQDR